MPKAYTLEEIREASNFIDILNSVTAEKRGIFRLMVECLLLGADLAQMGSESKPPFPDSGQSGVRPSA